METESLRKQIMQTAATGNGFELFTQSELCCVSCSLDIIMEIYGSLSLISYSLYFSELTYCTVGIPLRIYFFFSFLVICLTFCQCCYFII